MIKKEEKRRETAVIWSALGIFLRDIAKKKR
jgi:hypothetical protein